MPLATFRSQLRETRVNESKALEQARGGLVTATKQQDENYEAYELL